jgi:hypothetical protein
MSQSLADQLLELAALLSEFASMPECKDQKLAEELASKCRSAAIKQALKDLKDGEKGYAEITAALGAATAAANQANQELSGVAQKIAAIATALDLAARFITAVVGVLGL